MKTVHPFIFILAVFALFTVRSAEAQTPETTQGAQIVFDKETHNYGDVYMHGDGNCIFRFSNTGNEPLILSDVKAGCGCTVPQWPREPLLPGDTASIKVRYTTLNRPHQINRSIVVTSNAVNRSSIILRLTGNVIEPPPAFTPEKLMDKSGAPVPE